MAQQKHNPLYDIDFYKSLKDDQAIEERLSGRLPIIDIAGHPFFVDVRYELLRPMDNFLSNGVELSKGAFESDDGQHLIFCYHMDKMEDIDYDLASAKDNIAMVRVPHYLDLDPVILATMADRVPWVYQEKNPMIMYRVADVVPITPELKRKMGGKQKLWDKVEQLFDMKTEQKQKIPIRKKGKGL